MFPCESLDAFDNLEMLHFEIIKKQGSMLRLQISILGFYCLAIK